MRNPLAALALLLTLAILVLPLGRPLAAQSSRGAFREIAREVIRIDGPRRGLKLALHHVSVAGSAAGMPIVLILHGSGLSVSGNPDYPFGGRSWMAALADQGLDVWALDQYGFGDSDRYPEMSDAPMAHPPVGRAEDFATETDSAVTYLCRHAGVGRVMLIGDSGGSMVAGIFAARRPNLISRLVLYGPVTPFTEGPPASAKLPAYTDDTPRSFWDLFARWSSHAGDPEVLDSTMYTAWAATVLKSDPTSGTRSPASIRIPNGWAADLSAVAAGHFPYDPGAIRAPTLVLIGEADAIATLQGAQWLLAGLKNSPHRRLVVIGHGSHTTQFEAERFQLYGVMSEFLLERLPSW